MRRVKVDDLIVMAKRWVAMVDQDGAEPKENKQSVSCGRTGDALHGTFTLFGEDAALFANAMENESDAIFRSEGEEQHLPHTERRAEALMNLLRSAVGVDPYYSEPGHPTVVVHVTPDQLSAEFTGRMCEVDPFGHVISEQAVRRLMCEAEIHRFLDRPRVRRARPGPG